MFFSKAFFWAQKGYECKDARSTELMGEFYECGVGIEKDYSKAFECYLKADTLGAYYAPYQLYRCYAYGIGVEKSVSASIEYALKGAKNHHPDACSIKHILNSKNHLKKRKNKGCNDSAYSGKSF